MPADSVKRFKQPSQSFQLFRLLGSPSGYTLVPFRQKVCMILSFVMLFFVGEFQTSKVVASPILNSSTLKTPEKSGRNFNLNDGAPSQGNRNLSPVNERTDNDFGLVEVSENDIPDDTEVYVLEETDMKDRKSDGEIMETANNIVFRPLFRYRSKQEALRRNSVGIKRRYFVPKRYYRRVYYPYYYRQSYYY